MKIIRKIILTICLFAATLLLLDKLYTILIRRNCNDMIANMPEMKKQFSVIYMGACQVQQGINPAIIDSINGFSSYVLSENHSNYADIFLRLYLYLKYNPPPKLLLLDLMPETLDAFDNKFCTYRFAIEIGDSVVNKTVRENDAPYLNYSKIPFMRYAYYSEYSTYSAVKGLQYIATNKKTPTRKDGYVPAPLWRGQLLADSFINENYKTSITFKIDKKQLHYLEEIVNLCKQRNIKPILIHTPIYNGSQIFRKNKDVIIQFISSYAASHDIPFWNFETIPLSEHARYFNAPVSLNAEGADMFSYYLGRYLFQNIKL
jgi:hypothetical protein